MTLGDAVIEVLGRGEEGKVSEVKMEVGGR